jgi:hypothetical protein
MIIEGEKKGLWRFKKPVVQAEPVVQTAPVVKEEKKDELVQTQTSQTPTTVEKPTNSAPAPVEPVQRESNEGNKVENTVEDKKVEIKLPVYLKTDSFVYKDANEKSQRTWLLKKGTAFNIVSPGPEGWYYVMDAEKRKGYVRTDVLSEHKP